MSERDVNRRLRLVSWPDPSPGLRARVLNDARVSKVNIAWTDRIWFSKRWRQCAVLAAVASIAAIVWPSPQRPELMHHSAVMAFAEDVALEAGFDRDAAVAFARRMALDASDRAVSAERVIATPLFEGDR